MMRSLPPPKGLGGIGSRNVNDRIHLYFSDNYGLTVTSAWQRHNLQNFNSRYSETEDAKGGNYQVLMTNPLLKLHSFHAGLSTLGFHICATQALEMAEKYRPDLIICDLKMPDGIELIRTQTITALVLGASDYILKVSISPEELTSQLQKIREKLELKKKTQQQTQADTVEESLIHQGRHAAWRFFHSQKLSSLRSALHHRHRHIKSWLSRALRDLS